MSKEIRINRNITLNIRTNEDHGRKLSKGKTNVPHEQDSTKMHVMILKYGISA